MSEKERKIPRHIAIILDGNGRWAKKRLLPRNAGHAAGSKNVEKICKAAWEWNMSRCMLSQLRTGLVHSQK
mgnify:CR=1 FL=1